MSTPQLIARRATSSAGRPDSKPFFWFEIEDTGDTAVRWRMCFDVLSINGVSRPHTIENAEFLLETREQAEWRIDVSGTAVIAGPDLVSVVETERREWLAEALREA